MKIQRTFALTAVMAALVGLPLAADWPTNEKIDLDAVYRIKDEGLQRSKVMEIESYLTDVYGPRLTGSPNIKEAAEWAQKTMKEWGLANVHIGDVAVRPRLAQRGDSSHRRCRRGRIRSSAIPKRGRRARTVRSRARRSWQSSAAKRTSTPSAASCAVSSSSGPRCATCRRTSTPPGHRYTDAELAELAMQPAGGRGRGRGNQVDPAFNRRRTQFWIDEGVAAVLDISRGDGGTLFVQGGGSRDPKDPPAPPQVVLAVEHYGRIVRTLEKKIPVTLQMDIENQFFDNDLNAFNVVAEIPGTDKADEVVMIGAHFDSWHTGTGATDNAAGSAVMMEAMRILKTTA